MMHDMMKAGMIFGFVMAIKERSDSVVARLRKAQQREEEALRDGVGEFRRARRRKPVLLILR
jgi:hypothetical protein